MRRQSGTTSAKVHNLKHYTQDLFQTSQRGTDFVTSSGLIPTLCTYRTVATMKWHWQMTS